MSEETESRKGVSLRPEAEKALSFQSYPPSTTIEGVWSKPLRKFRADNGWFAELMRCDGGDVQALPADTSFQARQVSLSEAAPGRINAFHVHPRETQDELWTVARGQLTVWLIDCRLASATSGVKQKLVLSGEELQQLHIPAGVAHGYQAGREGALLIYIMNQQFNADDPNEGRLPWDFFGPSLWEEDRG